MCCSVSNCSWKKNHNNHKNWINSCQIILLCSKNILIVKVWQPFLQNKDKAKRLKVKAKKVIQILYPQEALANSRGLGKLTLPSSAASSTTSLAGGAENNSGWFAWIWSWMSEWIYGPDISLHDCLAYFFSADELKGDNMYSCEKCKIIFYKLFCINTQYGCYSSIVFTLKMESVSKITIFNLKMMVKSGLGKIFLKFLNAGNYFSLIHK